MTNEQNKNWSPDKLGDEASLKDKDEIQREMRRGADERDVAGSVSSDDTPHGREEQKTVKKR
jgi:hypothetical protein